MLITKEWLDKTILLNQHGSYQLSPKQMELLHSWYPELFREGAGIDFIKHWNREILGKEISDVRAKIFLDAKVEEGRNRKVVSEHIKRCIQAGIEFCMYASGKKPEHPHVRIVSAIGHIPNVELLNVLFTPPPQELTVVEFLFEDSENYKHLECICGGLPIKDAEGKVCLETKLYSVEQPLYAGEEPIKKEIKDCTGKDIEECINELRKKKKLVIKRKPVVLTATPQNTEHKTTKQKDKEHKQAAKLAKKNGLSPIQPRSNFERLYDMFMDDYTEVNKKRTKKSLPELSVAEYAKIMNVDMQDPLSLMKYKPGKIDWEEVLK